MISIIVHVWNMHEMTADCINLIRETTQDYELILVDNGSVPPIAKPYMGFVDVTLIRNETNLGFPVAANQGGRAAKGDTIILLNNDVFTVPQWASRLEAHLGRFAIVGPMTNYCMGRQQIAIQAYMDKADLFKRSEGFAEGGGGL